LESKNVNIFRVFW